MKIQRIAAFSSGDAGGNPAGVVLCDALPDAGVMQAMAAEIGFSETVFAAPQDDAWRARYFAPMAEVPFCGHATIALGAALALSRGDGVFPLILNAARITVQGQLADGQISAALQSPPTSSSPAAPDIVARALTLFGWQMTDLDPRIPPAIACAGAQHLVLALGDRQTLREMSYDFLSGQAFMQELAFTTIALVQAETPSLFHARNPFAFGGVYEDPATGAAAAALAGYLRDLGWPHGGAIDIVQGEDMGMTSRLRAEITSIPGASIRVSGAAREM